MVEINTQSQENSAHTPSESDVSVGSPPSDDSIKVAKSEPQRTSSKRRRWRQSIPGLHNPEDVDDLRFEGLTYESVNEYRIGYPRWAAYQNSDPTFRVYKRFGTLRNEVILYRQQELAMLEDQLRKLDEEDCENKNFKTQSLMLNQAETDSKRMKLIDQIDAKLRQYDDLLEREQRSGLMQRPSPRGYRSLVNYIWNQKQIVKSETQFLKHRDDFVQLSERSESPLENIIDYVICNWIPTRWLRRQFSSESQINKTTDKFTTLPSPRKVFVIARLVATAWAIVLISVPLSVLASETFTSRTKLIVLMVSLFAFPIAIQVAARPRTLELFVATATYCAVLTTLLATSSTFSLSELQSQLAFSYASNPAPA